MNTKKLIYIIGLLFVNAFVLQANTIPFDFDKGLIIIEVSVDGKEMEFVFDTGSSDIILHQKNIDASMEFASLDGSMKAGEKTIENLNVGNIDKNNIDITTMDLSEVRSYLNRDIQGMLGSHIFSPSVIYINYITKELKLDSPEVYVDSYQHKVSYHTEYGTPICNIQVNGTSYAVLLDTGASTHFFDPSLGIEDDTRDGVSVTTVAGEQTSEAINVKVSALGSKENIEFQAYSKSFDAMNELLDEEMIMGILSISQISANSEVVFDTTHGIMYFN